MSVKEVTAEAQVDQHTGALWSNVGAIKAVTEAVQGTLGPKGLDCMLVDQYGRLVVTNDGITILKTMDVTHPAARILISAVEFQEELVGDGTTTAAIIAGALVSEGANQIMRGVPVIKVVDGIKQGLNRALELLEKMVVPIVTLDSPLLEAVTLISARNQSEIANLIIAAARELGVEILSKPGFKLAEEVFALEGADSCLILGTIIDREPLNQEILDYIGETRILILDDALEPVFLEREVLATEAGLKIWLQYQTQLKTDLEKLSLLGIKAIFTDRAISDQAAEMLTDLGIMAIDSVSRREWKRLAELSGARPIKRSSLAKSSAEIFNYTGVVSEIQLDHQFKQLRIFYKTGQKVLTILIGAHTKEVAGERERIAKDAAGALQTAWCGGVVSGGGSIELALARCLENEPVQGMNTYGYHCVIEALKRPMAQIAANAGFNPLEKVTAVLMAQAEVDQESLGIDCETGMVVDLKELSVWDPYLVKKTALQSAGEVAEAILKINLMIKMKEAVLD